MTSPTATRRLDSAAATLLRQTTPFSCHPQSARDSSVIVCLSLLTIALSQSARAQTSQNDDPPPEEEEVLFLDQFQPQTSKESDEVGASLWTELSENLRLNVDFISRFDTTRRRGDAAGMNALGLDIHKVFSDDLGDIGTLVLQPYIVRRDNALPVPAHVEDDDDWELEFHDFYFNLTRGSRGRMNLKIGHFDVPYGLEPRTDTHFTIHQLIPFQNIGMKKDWGLSLNGAMPSFDYELSLTQGSGFEVINAGKNFAVAGRIGTPSDRNFVIGGSMFYGQVIDPHRLHRWQAGLGPLSRVDRSLGKIPGGGRGEDNVVRRFRAGVDVTWMVNQFTFNGEASVGRDYSQDVFNALLDFDWTSADQRLSAYLQGIYLGQRTGFGWDEDILVRIGATWTVNESFSMSAQYRHDLKTFGPGLEDAGFTLQTRFRF